jgi:hypothetical protein
MARPKKEDETTFEPTKLAVSSLDMAAMLGVSLTPVKAYEAKGLIVRTLNKKIEAIGSFKRIIEHLRAAAGNHSTGSSGDTKEEKLQEEVRQLRLANAKAEGQLVDIESVHTLVRKTLVGTADWLESLPDAFEATGIISPGMTDEFIRVLDNQREVLLSVNLRDIGLDGDEDYQE